MGLSGLEPPTSRLSGVRSNRLSYKPMFPDAQRLLCGSDFSGHNSCIPAGASSFCPASLRLFTRSFPHGGPWSYSGFEPCMRFRTSSVARTPGLLFPVCPVHDEADFVRGGDKRDRTVDLLLAKQALSQLSYTPMFGSDSTVVVLLSLSLFRRLSVSFRRLSTSVSLRLQGPDSLWAFGGVFRLSRHPRGLQN